MRDIYFFKNLKILYTAGFKKNFIAIFLGRARSTIGIELGKMSMSIGMWIVQSRLTEAKERIGNEQFEQLMSMRERAFGSFREGKRPDNIPGVVS